MIKYTVKNTMCLKVCVHFQPKLIVENIFLSEGQHGFACLREVQKNRTSHNVTAIFLLAAIYLEKRALSGRNHFYKFHQRDAKL